MNLQATKIHQLQKELWTLKQQRKVASKVENQLLAKLLNMPTVEFALMETSWMEVKDVIKEAISAFAPGWSTGPYTACTCYLHLLLSLLKIFTVIWCRGWVAKWRCAEGILILKEEKSTVISQFRSISLLNVKGKIFIIISVNSQSTIRSTPLFKRVTSLECLVGSNTLV